MKSKSTEKRLAILKAAFQVVTERGYSDTKVEDVAQRAGVAKGTVYLYFKDKADIYIGLVDWLLEQAVAAMAEVSSKPLSPRAKLSAIFEVWAGSVLSNPAALSLFSMENFNPTSTVMKRFHKHCLPHVQEMTGAIAGLIADGVKAGEFRSVEPRLAALLYMSAFRAAIYAVMNKLPVPNPTQAVQRLFFCGILARPGTTEKPKTKER